MNILKEKLLTLMEAWRADGVLHVVYALLAEALLIGYLYFIGLFTVETLLPTFVTVRFSLTTFLFILVLATIALSLLGRFLDLSFSWKITKKSPLLWLGIIWGIGILVVSLFKFPWPLIPLLIALLLLSGRLFWKIFFEEK